MFNSTILLALSIAISGYFYISRVYRYKFYVPRYQGHHLLYRVIFTGLIFFTIAVILYALSMPYTFKYDYFYSILEVVFPKINQTWFNLICISILGIFYSFLISSIVNFYEEWKFYKKIVRKRAKRKESFKEFMKSRKKIKKYIDINEYEEATNSELIRQAIQSYKGGEPVLITLSNRKSYVCYIFHIEPPIDGIEPEQISIIPIYTGYRDKNDLCLELTTPYKKVIEIIDDDNPENDDKLIDYKVTLSNKEILSIAMFDLTQYKQFKQLENTRRKDIYEARKT